MIHKALDAARGCLLQTAPGVEADKACYEICVDPAGDLAIDLRDHPASQLAQQGRFWAAILESHSPSYWSRR